MGRPFKTSIDIQVRFCDMDAFGHVNNATYLTYLELARVHYWGQMSQRGSWRDVDFVVARAEIDYRRPVTLDDEITVWVRVPEIRRSSFVMEYRIEDKVAGHLMAEAKTVQAGYDFSKKKVKRLSDDFKRRIIAFESPNPVLTPVSS